MQLILFSPRLSECFTSIQPNWKTFSLVPKIPLYPHLLFFTFVTFLPSVCSSYWLRWLDFPAPFSGMCSLLLSFLRDAFHSHISKFHLHSHRYKIATSNQTSLLLCSCTFNCLLNMTCCSHLALNMSKSEVSFPRKALSVFPIFSENNNALSPPCESQKSGKSSFSSFPPSTI